MVLNVSVDGRKAKALFDTGSQLSFICSRFKKSSRGSVLETKGSVTVENIIYVFMQNVLVFLTIRLSNKPI